MFKIDRKKSNRIVNSVKLITFASLLALANPITSNASSEESNVETKHESYDSNKLKYGLYILPFASILLIDIKIYNENIRDDERIENQKKKEKKKDSE